MKSLHQIYRSLPPCCVWPRRTPWANTGQLFHPRFCLLALPGSNLLLVVGPERFSSLLPVIGEDKLQSCFRKHVQLPFSFKCIFILFFFAFTEDGHWMLMNHLGCFSFLSVSFFIFICNCCSVIHYTALFFSFVFFWGGRFVFLPHSQSCPCSARRGRPDWFDVNFNEEAENLMSVPDLHLNENSLGGF